MSMTLESKSYNVLISFHQAAISMAPTVYTVIIDWNVSNEDGLTTDGFEGGKFLFEPCDFVAWVVSILDELPVHVVASLGVHSDDLGGIENSAILEFQELRVVTILSELSNSLRFKPVKPISREAIDGDVSVRI